MQTVLITGANGFVGNYLTSYMLDAGYRVVASGKGPERLQFKHPQYQYIPLDITNVVEVEKAFTIYQPQVVVHAGAMTKPDDCELQQEAAWAVNVSGTEHLLHAAEKQQSFFVHISTDFVFAGTAEKYSEEDEGDPANYYGLTKWEAEKRVKAFTGHWAIIRPILIYGNPQVGRSNILTFVADNLEKGKEVRLFTDQLRLPTYVEDFVWGIGKVVKSQATGIFHFSGKDALSPFDIGVKVAEHLNLDKSLVKPVTAADFQQPAKRPPQTLFDCAKTKALFDYQPRSFEEGLQQTFKQIRKDKETSGAIN